MNANQLAFLFALPEFKEKLQELIEVSKELMPELFEPKPTQGELFASIVAANSERLRGVRRG